ncbi:hypothetical protein TrLO_g15244 [Triparma laevis f. longispina]|uniref:Uncharacterized protein n=1 Tax=Triparma laevis f. longispina TaxID=1714387 RepID=A0A9W7E0K6_9STRA|nr:hypothetical protein TrLO_g15244 [Triparma laevis f. longispina]
MFTDIVMIIEYTKGEEYGFARACLICVSLNLIIQSILAFVVNADMPLQVILQEQFYTFTLIKPGIDAYRVATGVEMEEGRKVSSREEMTGARIFEMVIEAVTGTVIQASAIFSSAQFRTPTAFLALTSSISAAAFPSAVISYDYDSNSDTRSKSPSFYGYIPNSLGRKGICFASLFFVSACYLVIRTLACLILAARNVSWR